MRKIATKVQQKMHIRKKSEHFVHVKVAIFREIYKKCLCTSKKCITFACLFVLIIMRKSIIYFLVLVAACTCCGVIYARMASHAEVAASTSLTTIDTIPVCDTLPAVDTIREVTIACVGDMVLGINYPSNAQLLPAYDGAHLFDDVRPYLENADFTAGNLECLLLDRGGKCRTVRDPKYAYFFRSPERYVNHFVNAGFDFLSIANNHLRDFGEEGIVSTMRVLDQAGIAYAGLRERAELAVVERDGIRYGVCAFAPFIDMCDIYDFEHVSHTICLLREQHRCDLVIVTHHGGAEGTAATRVTRKDEFFGGGRRGNVYDFSHHCIDAGADLVFGHGPHVVRGMELYKGKIIAYSLGNFCTPYSVYIKGLSGYAPVLLVTLNTRGEFCGGRVVSARQIDRSGPKLDPTNSVVKEIRRLSLIDFPDSPLIIANDGTLSSAR